MNNLQLNNKNTITTLEIADMLEINHWEVLRKLIFLTTTILLWLITL